MNAPEEPDALTLIVEDPSDADERADVVLGRRLPSISRRIARRLGLEGHLEIDGRRAPPSTRVTTGMQLRLRVGAPTPAPSATVLAHSDDFVYVLKPAGLHTHRLRPDDAVTLADTVARDFPECRHASPDPRQGGSVHRLDLHTTGVVAFARTLAAWRRAREGFRSRTVLKLYQAQVTGAADPWPPAEPEVSPIDEPAPRGPWPAPTERGVTIDVPLGAAGRSRVTPRASGRPAVTRVWPLPPDRDRPAYGPQLLLLQLVTGHRHQARVHLAWLGRPIVGDVTYGGETAPSLRLHATLLDLSGCCPDESPVVAPVPDQWSTPPSPRELGDTPER